MPMITVPRLNTDAPLPEAEPTTPDVTAEGTRPGRIVPPPPPPKRRHDYVDRAANIIGEAIDAERASLVETFCSLPAGCTLTPAEVAAIIRARPRR